MRRDIKLTLQSQSCCVETVEKRRRWLGSLDLVESSTLFISGCCIFKALFRYKTCTSSLSILQLHPIIQNNHFPSYTISEDMEEISILFFQIHPKAWERTHYSDFDQLPHFLLTISSVPDYDVSLPSNETTRSVSHHMHCTLLQGWGTAPQPKELHSRHHSHSYKRVPFHHRYLDAENVPLAIALGLPLCGRSMYPMSAD